MTIRRALPAAIAAAVAALASGPAGAARSDCFSGWNPPNSLVLVAGSPQQGQIGKPFQTNLQVQLANTDGCPLTGSWAGVSVVFTAPSSGPGGTFAATGTNVADIGTDANGTAVAPTFTANRTAGNYEIVASSSYGSITLYLTNTATGVAASIAPRGSSSLSATVGTRYPPLAALVLDANGQPVAGAAVDFQIETGTRGASAGFVTGGAQAAAVSDGNGIATSPALTAGSSPGRFTATATTDGVPAPVGFHLRNLAPRLTPLTRAETATVDGRYRRPLQAHVTDVHGHPLEGVTVTFSLPQAATGAGASFLGGSSQATATTNAHGNATSPPLVANSSPGRFTATATTDGVPAPVGFHLRNLAPRLTPLTRAETATVDGRYRRPLQAHVTDVHGHPLEGVTVTFSLPQAATGAGASFADGSSQATATTNAHGNATSPPLVANNSPGRFTATATIAANPKPVVYSLRNVAGTPAAIAVGAASGEATTAGSRFPIRLAVTVTDKEGNPVPGALVTFTAPAGRGPGGHFTIRDVRRHRSHASRTARVRTDSTGVAIAPAFTANMQAGGYAVTARAGGTKAAFALVNTPR